MENTVCTYDVLAKINKILVEKIGIDESENVNETTTFQELTQSCIDSLDYAELITELESEYHIDIESNKSSGFITIGDLIECVRSKVNDNKKINNIELWDSVIDKVKYSNKIQRALIEELKDTYTLTKK